MKFSSSFPFFQKKLKYIGRHGKSGSQPMVFGDQQNRLKYNLATHIKVVQLRFWRFKVSPSDPKVGRTPLVESKNRSVTIQTLCWSRALAISLTASRLASKAPLMRAVLRSRTDFSVSLMVFSTSMADMYLTALWPPVTAALAALLPTNPAMATFFSRMFSAC